MNESSGDLGVLRVFGSSELRVVGDGKTSITGVAGDGSGSVTLGGFTTFGTLSTCFAKVVLVGRSRSVIHFIVIGVGPSTHNQH